MLPSAAAGELGWATRGGLGIGIAWRAVLVAMGG